MSKDHDYKTVDHKDLEASLSRLSDWGLKSGKLSASFGFKNFKQAFGFMTQVALAAEKLDHHPDFWNSYNRVSIDLITHQTESITDFDLKLAEEITDIYKGFRKT